MDELEKGEKGGDGGDGCEYILCAILPPAAGLINLEGTLVADHVRMI